MDSLKLVALDTDDLAVVSAHLQDGIIKTGDMVYLPKEQKFVFAVRRFDWEISENEHPRRRLSGVHFDRVSSVRTKGINRTAPDEVLNLLAMTFSCKAEPSGIVTLLFSGDREIELELECIEMQMKDLGPVWEVESRPEHSD
jgi:Protein of unknown function (DUF2948).